MRRHDKKLWMEHVNKEFEKRCLKESSLDENDHEEDKHDYYYPYDQKNEKRKDYDPYELKEKIVGLGDDLEYVDEKCSCGLEEEPTDVKKSYWFSQTDGELATDKILN